MGHELTSRIAALAVAAVVLGGCSDEGDGDAAPTPSSTSSSSSEPSEPTSSAAPEVPELPEAATGTDDAAAVAFVEHWVELLNYALVTGNSSALEAAFEPTCSACAAIVDNIDGPAQADDPGWSWTATRTEAPIATDPEETDVIAVGDLETATRSGIAAFGLGHSGTDWTVIWLEVVEQ